MLVSDVQGNILGIEDYNEYETFGPNNEYLRCAFCRNTFKVKNMKCAHSNICRKKRKKLDFCVSSDNISFSSGACKRIENNENLNVNFGFNDEKETSGLENIKPTSTSQIIEKSVGSEFADSLNIFEHETKKTYNEVHDKSK